MSSRLQLGYQSGELYTYGHSSQLPTIPIVAGFRECQGGEANIFACKEMSTGKGQYSDHDAPTDRDCMNGCLGADGIQVGLGRIAILKIGTTNLLVKLV